MCYLPTGFAFIVQPKKEQSKTLAEAEGFSSFRLCFRLRPYFCFLNTYDPIEKKEREKSET